MLMALSLMRLMARWARLVMSDADDRGVVRGDYLD